MKNEIEKLRDKAAEVAEHFANRADFYVRSGSEIFNLNHNDFSDVFTEQMVAEEYMQKFQWYLDDSPLIEESGIDIKKEASVLKKSMIYKSYFFLCRLWIQLSFIFLKRKENHV